MTDSLPKSPAPRVALFGLFGGLNIGNEASLAAMINLLTRIAPKAELSCICSVPEAIAKQYRIPAFPIVRPGFRNIIARVANRLLFRWPLRINSIVWAIRRMGDVDVLLVPGTGMFDDYGRGVLSTPFETLFWTVAARLRGAKILFVSVGAGPIESPASRALFRSAASMAVYRSYRDQISKDFMQSIGLDTSNDAVHPDLVFGLDLHVDDRQMQSGKQTLTIGIGVMTYHGWQADRRLGGDIFETYIGKLTEFVFWLLRAGHNIRLLVGEDSDHLALEKLVQALSDRVGPLEAGRVVSEPILSLNDLAYQIGHTDLVVATRYHNVICALMCNRPAISLGYAAKNDAVMNDMGLGDYCQHIESFDVEILKRQFETLSKDRDLTVELMQSRNAAIRTRLTGQEARIQHIIIDRNICSRT